jgi:superoxide dismutase, Cu-Zn family
MKQRSDSRCRTPAFAVLGSLLLTIGCSPEEPEPPGARPAPEARAGERTDPPSDQLEADGAPRSTYPGLRSSAGPKHSAARADVRPIADCDVNGTIEFSRRLDSIVIDVMLTGLEPGPHGFHVHEHGDCGGAEASAAGDHYSPLESLHGAPRDGARERHAGDLGNVVADASGSVDTTLEDSLLQIDYEYGVAGRAIVVHAGADDLESQPSGNSGPPVACGVIRPVASPSPG